MNPLRQLQRGLDKVRQTCPPAPLPPAPRPSMHKAARPHPQRPQPTETPGAHNLTLRPAGHTLCAGHVLFEA